MRASWVIATPVTLGKSRLQLGRNAPPTISNSMLMTQQLRLSERRRGSGEFVECAQYPGKGWCDDEHGRNGAHALLCNQPSLGSSHDKKIAALVRMHEIA